MLHMKRRLKLTADSRISGSYRRGDYKSDTIYTFYHYKEIIAVHSRSTGTINCTDYLSEQIFRDNLIPLEVKIAWEQRLHQYFCPIDTHDEKSIEQIYSEINELRKTYIGAEALEKEYDLRVGRGCDFDPTSGIDQREKKADLVRSCKALLFILCQPELSGLMEQDMNWAKKEGKEIYLLTYKDQNVDLAEIPWDAQLQHLIDERKVCVFFYGEEGLLHCRDLLVDAVVYAVPTGYYTKALTNQFGISRACVIYVPAKFDITKWVPLTERTKVTYWQLAKLWEVYGDDIYSYTVGELYQKYPQFFLNIYENGICCCEADSGYPIRIIDKSSDSSESVRQFDRLRNQAICDYLNCSGTLNYYSTYFDEGIEIKEIPWGSDTQQTGIMVQAVKVKRVNDSYVINCEHDSTLRERLKKEAKQVQHIRKTDRFQLFSNFLFFLTPKLSRLYNDLRQDRPAEQLAFDKMHLDYMRCDVNGKRIETFPLFRKACIAMKDDGRFFFFNFRLGGGRMKIGDCPIAWRAEDVDVYASANAGKEQHIRQVQIYTPYSTIDSEGADMKSFRLPVGEGRLNIIIVQDQITCIRYGSVILPSIGVVISLDEKLGKEFLLINNLCILEDGYVAHRNLDLTLELDCPAGVLEDDWKHVKWAYGGGLSLILNGTGLNDTPVTMVQQLRYEGWLSPLSCQTQESAMHKLIKHPRTAIGTTNDGALVIIVYSGRTRLSTGADYNEMIIIARKLFPNIKNLMNVDGGGSAMLGMAIDGNFMELSYPSTSIESCAGMMRPVNTVLCLEIGEEEKND